MSLPFFPSPLNSGRPFDHKPFERQTPQSIQKAKLHETPATPGTPRKTKKTILRAPLDLQPKPRNCFQYQTRSRRHEAFHPFSIILAFKHSVSCPCTVERYSSTNVDRAYYFRMTGAKSASIQLRWSLCSAKIGRHLFGTPGECICPRRFVCSQRAASSRTMQYRLNRFTRAQL